MKAICRQGLNQPLSALLQHLNPLLRGWANYFRFGVSKATFSYLRAYSWARVVAGCPEHRVQMGVAPTAHFPGGGRRTAT